MTGRMSAARRAAIRARREAIGPNRNEGMAAIFASLDDVYSLLAALEAAEQRIAELEAMNVPQRDASSTVEYAACNTPKG